MGNRDINKMRFTSEYTNEELANLSPETPPAFWVPESWQRWWEGHGRAGGEVDGWCGHEFVWGKHDGNKVSSMWFIHDFWTSKHLEWLQPCVAVFFSTGSLRDTKHQESTRSHFPVRFFAQLFVSRYSSLQSFLPAWMRTLELGMERTKDGKWIKKITQLQTTISYVTWESEWFAADLFQQGILNVSNQLYLWKEMTYGVVFFGRKSRITRRPKAGGSLKNSGQLCRHFSFRKINAPRPGSS